MKTLITVIISAAFASAAWADDEARIVDNQKLVAPDDNVYSQLCIAALDSRYVVQQRAEELGVNPTRLGQVTCNDMSLREFAALYGQQQIVSQNMGGAGTP